MNQTVYHNGISIADRIKKLRQAKGLTQKAFADSLGIVQGYLSGIERGKKIPSRTLLMAICHVYGVRGEWLCGGNDPEPAEMTLSNDHFTGETAGTAIPLLGSIPGGFPGQVDPEHVRGVISLPEVPAGCFALIVDGDFMAPTIRDGDLAIFKPGGETDNRSIVLLNNRWGEAILRRCRVVGDEVYFSAENSVYAPFKADANTRIIGTVIDIWRRVRV